MTREDFIDCVVHACHNPAQNQGFPDRLYCAVCPVSHIIVQNSVNTITSYLVWLVGRGGNFNIFCLPCSRKVPPFGLLTHLSSEFLSFLSIYTLGSQVPVCLCVIGWSSSLTAAGAKHILVVAGVEEPARP